MARSFGGWSSDRAMRWPLDTGAYGFDCAQLNSAIRCHRLLISGGAANLQIGERRVKMQFQLRTRNSILSVTVFALLKATHLRKINCGAPQSHQTGRAVQWLGPGSFSSSGLGPGSWTPQIRVHQGNSPAVQITTPRESPSSPQARRALASGACGPPGPWFGRRGR